MGFETAMNYSKIIALIARLEANGRDHKAKADQVKAGTHRWHNGDVWKVPKAQQPKCGAKCRDGHACNRRPVPGKPRCKNHGGLSTGPKTEAGRKAIVESNQRRRKTPVEDTFQSRQEARSAKGIQNAGKTPNKAAHLATQVETTMQLLPEAQQQAVRLLYEDRQNDEAIARQCGVSRRTLARWKKLPDFDAAYTALAAQSSHEWR